jgi:hypothetical protein
MSLSSNRIQLWYQKALRLYPAAYQKEYAEEMQTVFELRLASVSGVSGREKLKFCLRELRDLPASVVAAYIRERNRLKMKNNLERWFVQEPGSGKEIFLAILPFLLTAVVTGVLAAIPAVDQFPMWAGLVILASLFLVQAVLGIIGLLVRLPRWSLPYAGVVIVLLSFGSLIIFDMVADKPWPDVNTYADTALFLVVFCLALFVMVSLVVLLSRKIKLTQPFAEQLKSDKTLLSFMLYGGTLVFVVANYEDIPDGGLYMMLSGLAMMLGSWIYLRQSSVLGKILSLSIGNSAAIFFSILANVLLFDISQQPAFYLGSIGVKPAVVYLLLTWLASQVMIFAPLLLGNIFGSRKGEPESLAV